MSAVANQKEASSTQSDGPISPHVRSGSTQGRLEQSVKSYDQTLSSGDDDAENGSSGVKHGIQAEQHEWSGRISRIPQAEERSSSFRSSLNGMQLPVGEPHTPQGEVAESDPTKDEMQLDELCRLHDECDALSEALVSAQTAREFDEVLSKMSKIESALGVDPNSHVSSPDLPPFRPEVPDSQVTFSQEESLEGLELLFKQKRAKERARKAATQGGTEQQSSTQNSGITASLDDNVSRESGQQVSSIGASTRGDFKADAPALRDSAAQGTV